MHNNTNVQIQAKKTSAQSNLHMQRRHTIVLRSYPNKYEQFRLKSAIMASFVGSRHMYSKGQYSKTSRRIILNVNPILRSTAFYKFVDAINSTSFGFCD